MQHIIFDGWIKKKKNNDLWKNNKFNVWQYKIFLCVKYNQLVLQLGLITTLSLCLYTFFISCIKIDDPIVESFLVDKHNKNMDQSFIPPIVRILSSFLKKASCLQEFEIINIDESFFVSYYCKNFLIWFENSFESCQKNWRNKHICCKKMKSSSIVSRFFWSSNVTIQKA